MGTSMDYGPAPESAAEATAWIAAHESTFGLFIGGEWTPSANGTTLDTFNPATGDIHSTDFANESSSPSGFATLYCINQ